MITSKKNYNLYGPQNSWDMNYHLLDDKKKIEYLIDIDDVTSDMDNEGLYIETLIKLEDIDEILTYVWKEKKYISDTNLNLLNGSKRTIEQLININ